MIEMKSVPWHDIDEVWPLMVKYVEDVIEHSQGTLTAASIKDAIGLRDMQAMVAVDEEGEVVGVLITEVHKAVSGLGYIYVVALAGDRFDDWRETGNNLLKSWAVSMSAPMVCFNGRRGWMKKLTDLGWKETSVVMTLDLRQ